MLRAASAERRGENPHKSRKFYSGESKHENWAIFFFFVPIRATHGSSRVSHLITGCAQCQTISDHRRESESEARWREQRLIEWYRKFFTSIKSQHLSTNWILTTLSLLAFCSWITDAEWEITKKKKIIPVPTENCHSLSRSRWIIYALKYPREKKFLSKGEREIWELLTWMDSWDGIICRLTPTHIFHSPISI